MIFFIKERGTTWAEYSKSLVFLFKSQFGSAWDEHFWIIKIEVNSEYLILSIKMVEKTKRKIKNTTKDSALLD